MSASIPLIPRIKSDAQSNLMAYIAHAKNNLTAFGANLDFDADSWDVTEFYSKKGHGNSKQGTINIHFRQRFKDGGTPFCEQIRDFSKAYVRNQLANLASASFFYAITAFRALDEAIQNLYVPSLVECDATTFNKAAEIMKMRSPSGDNPSAGSILGVIARFLDEKGMVYAPLHNWNYPRVRKSTEGRIGLEFERRLREKMPAEDALEGLAQAFQLATEPRDMLITSVAAIMCSAPERINEVFLLPEKCEAEQKDKDGKTYLGLRWAGSKGNSDHIKWILPSMRDVVEEALTRIRRITEPARVMARWYEKNPKRLYLPKNLKYLRKKEILTLSEVGLIVNLSQNSKQGREWMQRRNIPFTYTLLKHPIQGDIAVRAARFADIESYVINTLPPGFPIYDEKRVLKYSDALLVFPQGMFGNRGNNGGSRCMFEIMKYHHVGCALGQNNKRGSTTVFQRVGIDPEGILSMRSHMFRHWHNTLAQGANVSQVDIAKWSGRASIYQNSSYDHVTSEQIVTRIRDAIGDSAKVVGPLAEIPKNLPVKRAEFAAMVVPTAHVTLYGFCIHDFTTLPCEMFRQCLDCSDHVCIKGLPDRTERIKQTLESTRGLLAKAKRSVVEEVYGAEEWVATHRATVDRLEELMGILSSSKVADGAVIQLSTTNTYTLSEGALIDRSRFEKSSASELPCPAAKKESS